MLVNSIRLAFLSVNRQMTSVKKPFLIITLSGETKYDDCGHPPDKFNFISKSYRSLADLIKVFFQFFVVVATNNLHPEKETAIISKTRIFLIVFKISDINEK